MKQTIINKIMSNKRFEEVISVRERLSEKYGEITVAGGCLVDCYFDKDFYDIDMFISFIAHYFIYYSLFHINTLQLI